MALKEEPAFPVPGAALGMSLRDYFAGQALVGLLADGLGNNCPDVARGAYGVADAMMAERAKGNK